MSWGMGGEALSPQPGPCLRRWDKPGGGHLEERHVWERGALVLNPRGSQRATEHGLGRDPPPTRRVSGRPIDPACPRLFCHRACFTDEWSLASDKLILNPVSLKSCVTWAVQFLSWSPVWSSQAWV